VKVLYVNHTARMSGAEHTLVELLGDLPSGVSAVLAAPAGPLSDAVAPLGVPVVRLRGTHGGFKLHPLHTSRAIGELVLDGLALRRAARACGAQLVHANSTRAALAAALTLRRADAALVVHLHDVLGDDPLARLVRAVIRRRARLVLANSACAARALDAPSGPLVRVVANPVDLDRFDPARTDRRAARARLGIADDAPVLAVVGQITPWKGQDVAIRALAAVRRALPQAVLLVVGAPVFTGAGTRYDNLAYAAKLERLVVELGLDDAVRFLGQREDVPDLLAASDLALVPSWLEPFGRIVAEAMAMGVPVIATDQGGPPEILRDGGGCTLPPRDHARWAAEALELLQSEARRQPMGETGRRVARERFSLPAFTARVVAAYGEIADSQSRGEAPQRAVRGRYRAPAPGPGRPPGEPVRRRRG